MNIYKKITDEKKDETRRKNISIIFQDNNLLNDFTAIENVMMPLIIKVKM
jgi:ABC-type lipoprotein export system ATPase subunit